MHQRSKYTRALTDCGMIANKPRNNAVIIYGREFANLCMIANPDPSANLTSGTNFTKILDDGVIPYRCSCVNNIIPANFAVIFNHYWIEQITMRFKFFDFVTN